MNIYNTNTTNTINLYSVYGDSKFDGSLRENVLNYSNSSMVGNIYSSYTEGSGSTLISNKVNYTNATINGNVYASYVKDGYEANGNSVVLNSGIVNGNIYAAYAEKATSLKNNFVDLKGGTVKGTIYGAYTEHNTTSLSNNYITFANIQSNVSINGDIVASEINNTNNANSITNTILNITDSTSNSVQISGNIYAAKTNGTGILSNNTININLINASSIIAGSIYASYNTNTNGNTVNSSNNIINVEGTVVNSKLYASYTNQNADNNRINISANSIINNYVYASYIEKLNNSAVSSTNSRIEIGTNNTINGNIYANYVNLTVENTSAIETSSIININNGNTINKNIYGTYINSSTDINYANGINSIYIQDNNTINADIYTAVKNINGVITGIGTSDKVIINSNLEHMEGKNKIYIGDGTTGNKIIFAGKDSHLLSEKVIQGSPTIILANIANTEIDKTIIKDASTNIIINNNGNYTSNFDVNGDITLDLNLQNVKNNMLINTTGSIIKTGNGKVTLSLNALNTYNKYILFKTTDIGASTILNKDNFFLENDYIKDIIIGDGANGFEQGEIGLITYMGLNGVMDKAENLQSLDYLKPFTDAITESHNYMFDKDRRNQYINNKQFNLIRNLVFIFNDLNETPDGNNTIFNHKNPEFIEAVLKGWLPDLSGIVYKSSRNSFNSIVNRIDRRMDDLYSQTKEKVESRRPSYNYLITKNLEEYSNIFDYDYSPLKSKTKRVNNWFEIYTNSTTQDVEKNIDSYDSDSQNFILGKETIYGKKMIFGMMLNGNKNTSASDFKNIDIMSIGGGAYLRYSLNDIMFVSGIFSYNMNNYEEKTAKNLNYTHSTDQKYNIKDLYFNSDYASNQFSTSLSFGLESKFFVPKLEISHVLLKVDGYIDNYDHNITAKTYNTINGSASLFLKNFMNLKIGTLYIKPELFGKLNIGLITEDMEVSGKLNGNKTYTVNAGLLDDNFIQYGANISFEVKAVDFSLNYNAIQGKSFSSSEIGFNFNFLW